MQRIGRRSRLKPGMADEYIRAHREIWPEMQDVIALSGIKNYSIYIDGLDLFAYFEVDDVERAYRFLAEQPIARRWQAAMAGFMDSDNLTMPWQVLEEVFHLE
jgi:L-rhamnose mutarotase